MNLESKEQPTGITSDELQKKLREFFHARGQARMGKNFEERESTDRELVRDSIEKLKTESERFKFIFETEKGSIYFVTNTGQSLRFRNGDKGFEPQPVMDKIYFITEEQSNFLVEEIKHVGGSWHIADAIVDREIPVVSMGLGTVPLEIGFASRPGGNEIEETGTSIFIKGIPFINTDEKPFTRFLRDGTEIVVNPGDKFIDYQNIDGFHIGHPIKNVQKN